MRRALWAPMLLSLSIGAARPAHAQLASISILQAEDRRAPTPRDLAIIRGGLRSDDEQTARVAVRALGRLERPSLVSDIVPSLKHPLPEVRAEAANAIGQALQGLKKTKDTAVVDSMLGVLTARLNVETEPPVRAVICETIGRLPYAAPGQIDRAERTLVDEAGRNAPVAVRLGIAQGLYGLVRLHRTLRPIGAEARAALTALVTPRTGEAVSGARVRRIALEALIIAAPGDVPVMRTAAADPDAQVRRLAMRAASAPEIGAAGGETLLQGAADNSPMVRLEAVRGIGASRTDDRCPALVGALKDRDTAVDLMAIDGLAGCGASDAAVAALVRTANDLSEAGAPRGWHRSAHAIVALSAASPEKAAASLGQFTGSSVWQLRMYAARAAATLKNQPALESLARDDNDNVVEAAIEGLSKVAGHAGDALYIAALSRRGYQAIRAGARALEGTSHADLAVAALQPALQRLVAEGHDNGHDARDAISHTLAALGAPAPPQKARAPALFDLTADDVHRLAASRARITIRGVGTFEVVLVTAEAPATVVRFTRLAESGYYNGLTFHRVVPNFVIQGGSPGANEFVGDAMFMRDELGLWPHVRGAVGISTRGRDTGDAQIFIDLVDNPRLDHDYTVFAQVLNGMDVVDQILEGDVIDRIEILTN